MEPVTESQDLKSWLAGQGKSSSRTSGIDADYSGAFANDPKISQDIPGDLRSCHVLPAALSLWAVWWQFPVLQRCNVDSGHSLCARHAAGLCFWHCLGDQQSPWQATEERWEHDWQRAGWNLAEAVKICSCCQYFTCCGLSCRWHFQCLVFREK